MTIYWRREGKGIHVCRGTMLYGLAWRRWFFGLLVCPKPTLGAREGGR